MSIIRNPPHCTACERVLDDVEPVWVGFRRSPLFHWWVTTACRKCAKQFWPEWLSEKPKALKCCGCRRPVFHDNRVTRSVVSCSDSCRLRRVPVKHARVKCQTCGKRFVQKRTDARFCTSKCRVYGWREERA
jgi:hypothetical protein